MGEESLLVSLLTLPKPLRTSSSSALAKKDSASRDADSTESLQASWLRVVILLHTTALAASPSTELTSKTRTSLTSTLDVVSFLWPMLAQVPTALSSSFASLPLPISMVLMLFSVQSSKVLRFLMLWRVFKLVETTSHLNPSKSLPVALLSEHYYLQVRKYIL